MKWREYQERLAGKSEHWSRNRFKSLAANVVRYFPVASGRCIEAGCGEGLVSYALASARPGIRVVGMDISAVRLARAAQNVSEASFLAGDILSLPWKNETFDAAVCCEVLEHLPDDESAVGELFRVVKKGGSVLITVPDREELVWNVCPGCGAKVFKHGHIRSYTPGDVRDLLADYGDVSTVVPVGKKWRLFRNRLVSLLIPGRIYKGRYLLGLARKR